MRAAARLGDVVVDPAVWPEIIDQISKAIGATGGVLLQGYVRTPDIPRSPGVQELAETYFANKWHLRDFQAERGVRLVLKGQKIITDQDVATPEEIKHSAYYNELLAPHGFGWLAAVGFCVGSEPWFLTSHRTIKRGPFEQEDKRVLAQISRRLSEAANLSQAVSRSILTGAINALNSVRHPAVIVDRLGYVLDTNAAADQLFDSEICVRNRLLCVTDKHARAALESLVDALRVAGDTTPLPTGPIVVRREIKAPVLIRILPIEPAARCPFLGARALLLLLDLSERRPPESRLLITSFGLTAAEARLAALIGAGETIERAAEQLGISMQTARTQLKSVFGKTGTHRQAELVALIARLHGFS
jgi:DNA-binding CsgD family transcriptional regulator